MAAQQNIAVVGSGIGGLAASWYLGQKHHVSLYEQQPQPGMAAHGLEWGGVRVDMPLRVLYRGYYPTLTALYRDADIAITSADYSASFSDMGGDSYFRYRNWRPLSRVSLPYPAAGRMLARRSRRILLDLARLYRQAGQQSRRLKNSDMPLQQWLQEQQYSQAFCEDFLLPTFAAINTCSLDSVRQYPALLIVDYLRKGVLLEGVSRTVQGADHVVQQLSRRCAEQYMNCGIEKLQRHADKIVLHDSQGQQREYDHVVLATQGNQTLRLLGDQAQEAEHAMLATFRYEPSEVIVHTDEALMPTQRKHWSPVNFFKTADADKPMASIWLNRVLEMDDAAPDAFQSWNPLIPPDESKVQARARFERPLVDAASGQALQQLKQLHQQPGRRVWFCGSYAETGVPLLESAARSALNVARHLHAA